MQRVTQLQWEHSMQRGCLPVALLIQLPRARPAPKCRPLRGSVRSYQRVTHVLDQLLEPRAPELVLCHGFACCEEDGLRVLSQPQLTGLVVRSGGDSAPAAA